MFFQLCIFSSVNTGPFSNIYTLTEIMKFITKEFKDTRKIFFLDSFVFCIFATSLNYSYGWVTGDRETKKQHLIHILENVVCFTTLKFQPNHHYLLENIGSTNSSNLYFHLGF